MLHRREAPEQIVRTIVDAVNNYVGSCEQSDDMT